MRRADDPKCGRPRLPPTVRPVERRDAQGWLQLRTQLWPEGATAEHCEEIERYFAAQAGEPAAVLVAECDEALVGFAELSIRAYAEGCDTDRVAYLEGWFVAPAQRRNGIGRALLQAAESWARHAGCLEFASDASPENAASIAAHTALGFATAGTVLCFCRKL